MSRPNVPPYTDPISNARRMLARGRRRLNREKQQQKKEEEAESATTGPGPQAGENRPNTSQAGTSPAAVGHRPYRIPARPLLDAITEAASAVGAHDKEGARLRQVLDQAISAAVHGGEKKTDIAERAGLSPQALSNRLRRDRKRDPQQRRYLPAADPAGPEPPPRSHNPG